MLQLQIIRNEKERVVEGLKKRNWSDAQIAVIEEILRRTSSNRKKEQELVV